MNPHLANEENDVTWVLTVPAIWDEPAKQFMEEAAEKKPPPFTANGFQ